MPFQLVIFFFLLFLLFFLSQKISTNIYNSVFILTKNKNVAVGILVAILLPGTIIHEVSHFLIATILRVPTGELTVVPTIEEDGEVKAGKLFLEATDPFRLSLIGLAPMIIGLAIIYIIGKVAIPNINSLLTTNYQLLTIFGLYLLIIMSITMFSSKKDMQGFLIAGPVTLILIFALYYVGVRVFLDKTLITKLISFLSELNYYLVITAILNFLIFLILSTNLYLWKKILKRKIA